MSTVAWDDERWRGSGDNEWARGCRSLQGWWRTERLGLPAGPHKATKPDRLVGSMLPLDAPSDANYLSTEAVDTARRRLGEGGGGLVDTDRLARNLLSSQPVCFNLFGHLQHHPDVLVEWLRAMGIDADAVIEVRLEWAPSPADHFDGGSAFDALVVYGRGSTRGFVGVECKYAENLSDQRLKPRAPYIDFTRASNYWRTGSPERLRAHETVQLWLNTLLAQSCVDVAQEGWTEGSVVMLACGADTAAFEAAVRVRTELSAEPDGNQRWVAWSSYETVIDIAARRPELAEWADTFTARYLDFSPVAHLLDAEDPRVTGPSRPMIGDPATVADLAVAVEHAKMIALRVFGDGSIVEQVRQGDLDGAASVDVATLAARLREVAEATRLARVVAAPVWDRLVDGGEDG